MRKICKDNPNIGLSFLYNTYIGRIILKPLVKSRIISCLVGKYMDSFLSKIIIKPFIKANNINIDEFEKKDYKSFNDFFIRKIKVKNRIIDKAKDSFISPCDSKLTYYEINKNSTFKIKNSLYTVSSLLKDEQLSKKYKDGILLVFRLSPDDYHRYCYIDDGKINASYKINGLFHSVNTIVYDKCKVFKENTRQCTLINTRNFDDIVQIEVGALLVGKINNYKAFGNVKKGEEKGYFMYGGSTIIIILKKDVVKIDDEIINNSNMNLETYVKYGEKIGKKI